jgi:hypothetical protein
MPLLRSQKNELFALIETQGLSPAQFVFEPVPSRSGVVPTATRLSYRDSPYAFLFDRKGRREIHYVLYCPGLNEYEDEATPGTDWQLVKAYFKEWLNNLKREIGQEDRWQSLALTLSKPPLSFAKAAKSPFTIQEYERVTAMLEAAQTQIQELDLEEEEIEVLQVKFDHLARMAKKLDKSDWQDLFVGSLVSSISAMGLAPQTAQSVWNLLRQIFNNLLLG